MVHAELQRITPAIEGFSQKKFGERKFIRRLIQAEARENWHFTFDGMVGSGYRLQIRTPTHKIIVAFNADREYDIKSYPLVEHDSDIRHTIESDRTVVGISGPARRPIDQEVVDRQLEEIFSNYIPAKTYILTGGYPGGIPLRALEVAQKRGFQVVAIVPQVIFRPEFIEYVGRFDYLLKVGTDWGDETSAFARTIDILYVFGGGGPWTNLEYEQAMELKKPVKLMTPVRDRHGELSLKDTV